MNSVVEGASDAPMTPAEFHLGVDHHSGYVGDYYSDELGVIYRISQSEDGLKMDFPKGVAILQPVGEDIFNAHPIGEMTFERQSEKITGFRLDNGRVRRLLFEVWER